MLTRLRSRKYLTPQRMTGALAGFGCAIVLTAVTDRLAAQSLIVLGAIAGVTAVVWIISRLIQKAPNIEVSIHAPQTIRNKYDAMYYAREAFIGFVPLYRPLPGSSAQFLSASEQRAAVENLDFDRLQLEQSNLAPTIAAIEAHGSRLKHCWLLSTTGTNAAGSLPYAILIAEYLQQRKRLSCEFHYGAEFAIPLDDDALVLSKTYDAVRRIFAEVSRFNINQRDVVADITTGFRSMTLGMVLACLDKEHDIEFIGTHYDTSGSPNGDLTPIIFSFEPELNSSN